jgi:hypothetical protein
MVDVDVVGTVGSRRVGVHHDLLHVELGAVHLELFERNRRRTSPEHRIDRARVLFLWRGTEVAFRLYGGGSSHVELPRRLGASIADGFGQLAQDSHFVEFVLSRKLVSNTVNSSCSISVNNLVLRCEMQ